MSKIINDKQEATTDYARITVEELIHAKEILSWFAATVPSCRLKSGDRLDSTRLDNIPYITDSIQPSYLTAHASVPTSVRVLVGFAVGGTVMFNILSTLGPERVTVRCQDRWDGNPINLFNHVEVRVSLNGIESELIDKLRTNIEGGPMVEATKELKGGENVKATVGHKKSNHVNPLRNGLVELPSVEPITLPLAVAKAKAKVAKKLGSRTGTAGNTALDF